MREKIVVTGKFLFFVFSIPILISSTIGFRDQIVFLSHRETNAFLFSLLSYLFVHLVVGEPQDLYQYGQRMVSHIFKFFTPLVEVAPFFVPIYSFFALVVFFFVSLIFPMSRYNHIFIFFIGFTMMMHFVLTAKALREKEANVMKPHYFFSMSLIYIVNIFFISLFFDLILSDFSFPQFFKTTTDIASDIYRLVFTQLFVV